MKLGLKPLTLLFATLFFFAGTARAQAAPGRLAQEDALADGEIDSDDVAIASPLAALARARLGSRVLTGPSGAAWVSLVGFARRTLDERREIGGFVVLGLPLDRFARGTTRMTPAPARAEPVSISGPELLAVEPASAQESPFDLALTPRLARGCVGAAWRAAGLGADDARLDAIVSRARWSAVLPEARLRAVRFEDARLSLDTGTDTSRLRDSAGANVGFEARLTWRFDRLIYADDEPSFERIRLEQRDARARIGARVLEALFHWQRAALDLRSLPPSQHGTRDEADVALRVMEAEAALDVLTNGWFALHRPRAGTSYAAPVPVTRGGSRDL